MQMILLVGMLCFWGCGDKKGNKSEVSSEGSIVITNQTEAKVRITIDGKRPKSLQRTSDALISFIELAPGESFTALSVKPGDHNVTATNRTIGTLSGITVNTGRKPPKAYSATKTVSITVGRSSSVVFLPTDNTLKKD